jgi:dTDP-4-dehydrorhamnose reductase
MINEESTRVLVLGASGMLGNAVLRLFAVSPGFEVVGSVRSLSALASLAPQIRGRVFSGIDVESHDSLVQLMATTRPQVVINCIGLVKQLATADDPLAALPINALLPHRLARLCALSGARLVHVSTDCVFSGAKGMYREDDLADATDLYGRSKHIGEVDYPHAITLRTSIIGHELGGPHGLIAWFLAQSSGVQGFARAIFSGLPTVELARVMRDVVIPRPDLHGVYHVSASAISKYDLLSLVASVYQKRIPIALDERLVIDRSLDSSRFRAATGYMAPEWPTLIRSMHEFG